MRILGFIFLSQLASWGKLDVVVQDEQPVLGIAQQQPSKLEKLPLPQDLEESTQAKQTSKQESFPLVQPETAPRPRNKTAVKEAPLPPAKLYDTIPDELIEESLEERLGLKLQMDDKLGVGGFGLVYKANLTDIDVSVCRKLSAEKSTMTRIHPAGASILDWLQENRKASAEENADKDHEEAYFEVAIKFFRKPDLSKRSVSVLKTLPSISVIMVICFDILTIIV